MPGLKRIMGLDKPAAMDFGKEKLPVDEMVSFAERLANQVLVKMEVQVIAASRHPLQLETGSNPGTAFEAHLHNTAT